MLKNIVPNLMVEDVNQTIKFYQEILGFQVMATVPESGQFDWAMLKADEVELMFQARASLEEELPVFKERPIGGSLTLYTGVTNSQEMYERLKDQVTIVAEPHTTFYGAREFGMLDCNGYVLVFSTSTQA